MSGGEPETVLEVEALVKRFGTYEAVRDLSFTLRRGEIFGLLGPNGSGKTTTVNLISGLSAPTAGTVRVLGRDPRHQAAEVRRRLGVVPQETALYEELSAERNLRFHAELYGVPARLRSERVTAMLSLAQLTDHARTRVDTFSGGMKRRLAIARALLHDPDLVYLDEPTLGVDVQARHVIWEHIKAMQAAGRTVLLTTNYLEESDRLCDRILVIDHGRVVAEGSPAQLKQRFGSGAVDLKVGTSPGPEAASRLRDIPGVAEVEASGADLRLVLAAGEEVRPSAVLPRLLAVLSEQGIEIRDLAMREASLDDVFLALTGKEVRD